MTDNTIQPGTAHVKPGQPVFKNQLDDTGDTDAGTKSHAQANMVAKPQPMLKTVKGQKHVAPPGRHSQQSHWRARERAAAQGHTTIQEQHAHDRGTVKAEISRLAALKATQKAKPPK